MARSVRLPEERHPPASNDAAHRELRKGNPGDCLQEDSLLLASDEILAIVEARRQIAVEESGRHCHDPSVPWVDPLPAGAGRVAETPTMYSGRSLGVPSLQPRRSDAVTKHSVPVTLARILHFRTTPTVAQGVRRPTNVSPLGAHEMDTSTKSSASEEASAMKDRAVGAAKDKFGEATGNPSLERRGEAQNATGQARQAANDVFTSSTDDGYVTGFLDDPTLAGSAYSRLRERDYAAEDIDVVCPTRRAISISRAPRWERRRPRD